MLGDPSSLRLHAARVGRPQAEVAPRCPHFGTCGGCQYQDIAYDDQLNLKHETLRAQLDAASVRWQHKIQVHGAESYEYRNRIRMRVEMVEGVLRFGYNKRATTDFLPIVTCPIAAPVLWSTAEALLQAAKQDADAAFWLNAASEVELFCNDDLTRLQITLHCAPRTKAKQGSIERCLAAIMRVAPVVAGLSAIANDPRTGPTGRTLASAGTPGLSYRVLDQTYWISRGGFFQINRFLLGELVKLVCEADGEPRKGDLAWDLYAGVGLFSHVLARSSARVVAVEANAVAATDNRNGLRKLGPTHEAVAQSTLDFLRAAVIQRERPELIVLDPPRAGAGVEACEFLLRLAAPEMVYVSCDPTTLVRDLVVLTRGYDITAVHVVDLFPQTFHIETVVLLRAE